MYHTAGLSPADAAGGSHWRSASRFAASATDPPGSRRSSSSYSPNSSAAGRPSRSPAGPTRATGPSPDSRQIHPQRRAAPDLPARPTGGTPRAWPGPRGGPVPRAADVFLNTYPVRRSARNTLDRWTRCARGTRRLYTRVKSSVVASGVSRTTACSTVSTTGEDHPPRLPRAATVPVARRRWTQRSSVQRFTENRSATVAYDAPPGSYARTARSRSSMG